jgi:hypothetical protein
MAKTGEKFEIRNWCFIFTYSIGETWELVDDGIPHRVQILNTVFFWDFLSITALIASWEFSVDAGTVMEWLVNVA